MDFIFDNLQVFLVVAGLIVAGLSKLREMRAGQKEEPWQPPEETYDDSEEEFYPAKPTVPPPLRSSAPPPMPRAEEFQPSFEGEPELERQRKLQERLKALRATKAATVSSKAAKKLPSPKPQIVSPTKIRSRLRDSKELRQAIVMREILGRPVGLK